MNKDKRNNIKLLGTLNNADESGIIANANQIYDANENKSTQDVSKEHTERIKILETKENSMQTTLENITKTGEASAASNVTYNHNDSKLDATNVQQAVDEVLKRSNYNDGDEVIDFNTIHLITDNPEFVCVAVDANEKILYGIKTDGQPYFGVGCPQQVKDYINKQINKILGTDDISSTIDSLKEIEAFLKDFTNSDTLKKLLDLKANVDEVRATTDDIYKKSNPNDEEGNIVDTNTISSIVDNPEYIQAITDSVGRLIEAIGLDGVIKFFTGINIQGNLYYSTDNPEYIAIWTDNQNKIVFGFKTNGEPYFGYGVSSQIKEYFASEIEKAIKKCKDNIKDSENKIDKKINLGSNTYPSNINSIEDNTEYIDIKTDSQGRIFESVDLKGKRKFHCGIDLIGASISTENNPEYTEVNIDKDNRILVARKTDGNVVNNNNIDFNGNVSFKNDITANGISITEMNNSLTEAKEKINSVANVSISEIELHLEEGDRDLNGIAVDANNKYRSQVLKDTGLYMVLFPDDVKVSYKAINQYKSYKLITAYAPFIINVQKGFGFNTFFIIEGKDKVVSLEELNIKVYYLPHSKSSNYDITIAASNSQVSDKERADIICDGENDTEILASCFNSFDSCKFLLYSGTYNVNKWYTIGKYKVAIPINLESEKSGDCRFIEAHGFNHNRTDVLIKVTKTAHDIMDTYNFKYRVIGCGLVDDSLLPGENSWNTAFYLEGINIDGYYYDKPIIYLDVAFCKSAAIKNCCVYSASHNAGIVFRTLPSEGVVGIRCGFGSDAGIAQSLETVIVCFCYTGVSCSGEHFIFKDVLVHTCYIGFAFGDYKTRGHYEHPNIMLGCSIEACYRYMLLTKQGIMQEIDNYTSSTEIEGFTEKDRENMFKSTIIAIGTSTETVWFFPYIKHFSSVDALPTNPNIGDVYRVGPTDLWKDEAYKKALYTWDGTQWVISAALQATKGILEMVKGFYRGRIEGDGLYAEQGSCKNITITKY